MNQMENHQWRNQSEIMGPLKLLDKVVIQNIMQSLKMSEICCV